MLFVRHEELESGAEGASQAADGVRQAHGSDALALVSSGMPGSTSAGAASALAAHFTDVVTARVDRPLSAAVLTALTLAGCTQTPTTTPQGASTVAATDPAATPMDSTSLDPDRPEEPVTGLPSGYVAINREMYHRLVQQWKPLLAAFPHTPTDATYVLNDAGTGKNGSEPSIEVGFGHHPEAQWAVLEKQMADAVHAQGWTQAGNLDPMLNVRKGPYFLRGGCNSNTCYWTIVSSTIPIPLPELADDTQGKTVTELLPHTTAPTTTH